MLSARAINTIKKMALERHLWNVYTLPSEFMGLLTPKEIISDFQTMKKQKKLKGAGPKTLDEILEFHKVLNEIWE